MVEGPTWCRLKVACNESEHLLSCQLLHYCRMLIIATPDRQYAIEACLCSDAVLYFVGVAVQLWQVFGSSMSGQPRLSRKKRREGARVRTVLSNCHQPECIVLTVQPKYCSEEVGQGADLQ